MPRITPTDKSAQLETQNIEAPRSKTPVIITAVVLSVLGAAAGILILLGAHHIDLGPFNFAASIPHQWAFVAFAFPAIGLMWGVGTLIICVKNKVNANAEEKITASELEKQREEAYFYRLPNDLDGDPIDIRKLPENLKQALSKHLQKIENAKTLEELNKAVIEMFSDLDRIAPQVVEAFRALIAKRSDYSSYKPNPDLYSKQ